MEPGIAFVPYDPKGHQKRSQKAREIRVHAGKVGWLKSNKAAEVEARRKKAEAAEQVKAKKTEDDDESTKYVEVLPRPVSPFFGGISIKTFDTADDPTSARISYLMLTAVWPNVAGESVAAPWFVDFCNDPLMFHTHCTAGAMYRDVLAQKSEWSHGAVTLTHKAKTLSIIKDSIGKLDSLPQIELERLILSMGILGVHDFQAGHVEHKPLPFSPHFPTANWLSLWGRTDPVEAHVMAVFAILQRIGGPKKLELPGLGYMACLSDLFRASVRYCKPLLEDIWEDLHLVDIMPDKPPHDDLPGIGFHNLPGGLPPHALSVFTTLAQLDRAMSHHPSAHHPTDPLQRLRLSICHKLLSLPPWDDIPTVPDSTFPSESHRSIYETIRLTSVIYTTAVLLVIPPHNGWNTRHTTLLVTLLSTARFELWTSDVEGLYLWTLIIGGMAAFGTENWRWFEGAFWKYVRVKGLGFEDVLGRCRGFVWTDAVCMKGARGMWDAAVAMASDEREDVKVEVKGYET